MPTNAIPMYMPTFEVDSLDPVLPSAPLVDPVTQNTLNLSNHYCSRNCKFTLIAVTNLTRFMPNGLKCVMARPKRSLE
jgi:hypothetical protein